MKGTVLRIAVTFILVAAFLGGSLVMLAPLEQADAGYRHEVIRRIYCHVCGALLSETIEVEYHSHS